MRVSADVVGLSTDETRALCVDALRDDGAEVFVFDHDTPSAGSNHGTNRHHPR
jgi:hypothetical protein